MSTHSPPPSPSPSSYGAAGTFLSFESARPKSLVNTCNNSNQRRRTHSFRGQTNTERVEKERRPIMHCIEIALH